jgi:hypothetical protein
VGIIAAATRSGMACALGVVMVDVLADGGHDPRWPDLGGSRIQASTTVVGMPAALGLVMVVVGGAGVDLHSWGNLVRADAWL